MATSIPKTQSNDSYPFQNDVEMQLSYQGKQSESSILQRSPAEEVTLWPSAEDRVNLTNHLYFGDNLPFLAAMYHNSAIRGQVRLVYIDPPYATGGVFQSRNQSEAYDDSVSGPRYIEYLRQCLIFLRELLAEDGSIYVQLDKNMAFHIKVIMDEIFGAKNFRSWITRKKCNPKNYTRKTYGNTADYILFYTKSDNCVWHRPVTAWTAGHLAKEYPCFDENGRRYKKVPVHAPGIRNGATGQQWHGMTPPPGKHWQYTPAKLDEMDAKGEIYWSPNGNPRRKVYFDNSEGVPVQDIWLEYFDPYNQNSQITGYPTEKPPDLLTRIIEASSNPGDLVLDCFAGSGTTLAVASQLKRRWLGIDNSPHALATILRRFVNGLKPMGDFVSLRQVRSSFQAALDWSFEVATLEPTSQVHKLIDDFTLIATPSNKLNLHLVSSMQLLQIADWFDDISKEQQKTRREL